MFLKNSNACKALNALYIMTWYHTLHQCNKSSNNMIMRTYFSIQQTNIYSLFHTMKLQHLANVRTARTASLEHLDDELGCGEKERRLVKSIKWKFYIKWSLSVMTQIQYKCSYSLQWNPFHYPRFPFSMCPIYMVQCEGAGLGPPDKVAILLCASQIQY